MLARLTSLTRSINREAHAVYLAARHPRTPWYAKALALAIAAYALSPIDLIPDFIPVLGLLDDILLLPLGIALVLRLTPADVMAESRAMAQAAAERPVSWMAASVIIVLWTAALALTAWVVAGWLDW